MSLFSERFYRAMEAKEQWRAEQRALPFEEKLRLLDALLRAEEEAKRRTRPKRPARPRTTSPGPELHAGRAHR